MTLLRMGPGPVAAVLLLLLLGCTPPETARSSVPAAKGRTAGAASASADAVGASATADATAGDPATEVLLLVRDPPALAALETLGLAFGDLVVGAGTGAASNRELGRSPRYRKLADTVAADIARVGRGDPAAGVGVQRFSHRLFDRRWLDDAAVRFELTAVVNRADRAVFRPGSCGEARLVYRLSYERGQGAEHVSSRLPMTASVELPILAEESGATASAAACARAVERWRAPAGLSGRALAEWLVRADGPLAPARLGRSLPSQRLALNVQAVRWPSTVRPDLGGHAEYVLRVFELGTAGDYVTAALENTPDRERLEREPRTRAALLAWIRDPDNLPAIDAGTALVPREFLAERASSVTPRGLARLANRPFASLFAARELSGLDLSSARFVGSPAGLLRRLDALSCPGCHAARSVAGFHLLGDEPAGAAAGNALAAGLSPHAVADLRRRAALASELSAGHAADYGQPFPERGDYDGYGAHCGLGADPTFSRWTCRAGLSCRPYDAPAGDDVGHCLPAAPGPGDPCEAGPIAAKLDARRDRVQRVERSPCGDRAVCNANAVGFPGGMCTESCAELSLDAACGAIAVLDPFNACLARAEPFASCLAAHVSPAGLRACQSDAPCRDDYVCARGASGGVCIPPYFLFQLRVDGHR